MSLEYIASDNQDCLTVHEELLSAVQKCGSYGVGYLNLGALFIHDLMKIVTGYVLRRSELSNPDWIPDSSRFSPLPRLPYVGYQDLTDSIQIEEKDFTPRTVPPGRKRRAIAALSAVRRPFLSPHTPHAVLGSPAAVDNLKLWCSLRSRGMRIGLSSPGPIPVREYDAQMLEITRSVEAIFDQIGIDDDPRPLQAVIRGHIRARVEEARPIRPQYDVLVTGTLMKLEDRGAAAVARANGIPVLSVMHGDQFGAYDEPHIGYGELTYASTFIGYGQGDAIGIDHMEYGRSLFDQPQYVAADSDVVRKQLRNHVISPLKVLESKRVMYVPTSLKGQHRYGPFHDIPDACYVAWQRTVLTAFPDAEIKLHPKSVVDPRDLGLKTQSVVGGNFQDHLDRADILVLDCLSTAFSLAAATDKPIIYCDIGFRNLSPRGKQAVQDRCLWIEADPWSTSADKLLELVMEQRDFSGFNSFSERYSLAPEGNAERRVDVVSRVAASLT